MLPLNCTSDLFKDRASAPPLATFPPLLNLLHRHYGRSLPRLWTPPPPCSASPPPPASPTQSQIPILFIININYRSCQTANIIFRPTAVIIGSFRGYWAAPKKTAKPQSKPSTIMIPNKFDCRRKTLRKKEEKYFWRHKELKNLISEEYCRNTAEETKG